MATPPALSPENVRALQERGFYVVRKFLDAAELDFLNEGYSSSGSLLCAATPN